MAQAVSMAYGCQPRMVALPNEPPFTARMAAASPDASPMVLRDLIVRGSYAPDINDGVKDNVRPFQEAGLPAIREAIKKW